MTKFVLDRFEYEPVEFTGRRLAAVSTPAVESSGASRLVELSLYENDDGVFVAQTLYRSSVESEPSVATTELLDSKTDVEDFFFAFEPDEFLRRAKVELEPTEWQTLAAQLYVRYETAAREVLGCLISRKESNTHAVNATDGSTSSRTA